MTDNFFKKYGNLVLKQGLELLEKEEVKSNLKEQYKTLVKIIFAEINIYVYITIILVFFIFLMLSIILFILVIRVIPFRDISSTPINILEIPGLFHKQSPS
jgi:fatty acid desaturase